MESDVGEIKLSFLLSGSFNVLPSSYIKLRSYLNVQSSNIASVHRLKLPKCLTNRNITCSYCYIPWSYNTTSFKLLPQRRIKTGKKTSQISKNEELSDHSRNQLVLKCKVCNKKSLFSLLKTERVKDKVEESDQLCKKKKKKKKKDKSCGLLINPKTSNKTEKNKLKHVKKKKRSETSNQSSFSKSESMDSKPSISSITGIQTSRLNSVDKQNNASHPSISAKKLFINPLALQIKDNKSKKRKNIEKLKKLQTAIKKDKGSVKKTLKDFLTPLMT